MLLAVDEVVGFGSSRAAPQASPAVRRFPLTTPCTQENGFS
ncbi:hypothetical protein PVAP13_8NG154203 [Panicum virgatum]|uniref:Uncharacterized protein n=1 Tax=Panicum virgatum TaxID=38727 RepID=A0A8T0PC49_PANVG|nr:hypothetical protein PVAP13_8NG154000 [Panicum virgatum]KAG2556826.1 hypothetical protein PVAP13_8NG154203 [Panicum virgatum]